MPSRKNKKQHKINNKSPEKSSSEESEEFDPIDVYPDFFQDLVGGTDLSQNDRNVTIKKSTKKWFHILDDKIAEAKKHIFDPLNFSDNFTFGEEDVLKSKCPKRPPKGPTVHFSEVVTHSALFTSFADMGVIEPLTTALHDICLNEPTAVQSANIPIALSGRDVCTCAVTGSGKTVAFVVPMIQRLLLNPSDEADTRAVILVPTRELAAQVADVVANLTKYTRISSALVTGGCALGDVRGDVLVATPGRLLDCAERDLVDLSSVEILVLDEADRLLDQHFSPQTREVVGLCSRVRQTMLLSATMTEEVEALSAVRLRSPVKVALNDSTLCLDLAQEFVRVRPEHEKDRTAILACLLSRMSSGRVIVFVNTKAEIRRLHVLLGLFGIRVGELQGNLTQTQRFSMLEMFRRRWMNILLVTDVAARGLDVEGVETIINYNMPLSVKVYIHRVGRTARAGKVGRSVSLLAEGDRRLLREIVRISRTAIRMRTIPTECLVAYAKVVDAMAGEVERIVEEGIEEDVNQEKTERVVRGSSALREVIPRGRPHRRSHQRGQFSVKAAKREFRNQYIDF